MHATHVWQCWGVIACYMAVTLSQKEKDGVVSECCTACPCSTLNATLTTISALWRIDCHKPVNDLHLDLFFHLCKRRNDSNWTWHHVCFFVMEDVWKLLSFCFFNNIIFLLQYRCYFSYVSVNKTEVVIITMDVKFCSCKYCNIFVWSNSQLAFMLS